MNAHIHLQIKQSVRAATDWVSRGWWLFGVRGWPTRQQSTGKQRRHFFGRVATLLYASASLVTLLPIWRMKSRQNLNFLKRSHYIRTHVRKSKFSKFARARPARHWQQLFCGVTQQNDAIPLPNCLAAIAITVRATICTFWAKWVGEKQKKLQKKSQQKRRALMKKGDNLVSFASINNDCKVHILSFLFAEDLNSFAMCNQDCHRIRAHQSLPQERTARLVCTERSTNEYRQQNQTQDRVARQMQLEWPKRYVEHVLASLQ